MAKTNSTPSFGPKDAHVHSSRLAGATAGLQAIKWETLEADQRERFLTQTWKEYTYLVNELMETSNDCVDKFQQYSRLHVRWRWTVIICTGVIALLNVGVSTSNSSSVNHSGASVQWLSVLASLFAVAVTILATLEGFTNAAERAQGYREAREIFIDICREFSSAWETYVDPLQQSAEACSNAAELHRRLITADREARSRFKDLTKDRKDRGGSQ
jgi:hypothetical protein